MGEGGEILEQEEDFPEAREKIENVKKNLLEYFDSDHIKSVFEKSKSSFQTVEETKGIIVIGGEKRNAQYFHYLGEYYAKGRKDGKYTYQKFKGDKFNQIENETPEPIIDIDRRGYNNALNAANILAKNETIDDAKNFLKTIDERIVIMPSSEWEKSASGGKNSGGVFFPGDNKIYIPEDASEFAIAHEVLHALQSNCCWIKNLLVTNQKEIRTVSGKLWDKFLTEYSPYMGLIGEYQTLNSTLKNMLAEAKKEDKKHLRKMIRFNKDEINESRGLMEPKNAVLEKEYRGRLFSDKEFHARLFELKYACKLYLGLDLGSPISIDHINQLMQNDEYLKDTKRFFTITGFLTFINKEIEDERDIDRRLELQDEKSQILEEILDLVNNDLVFNDQGNQGDLVPKST